jgi:hypothetical protein
MSTQIDGIDNVPNVSKYNVVNVAIQIGYGPMNLYPKLFNVDVIIVLIVINPSSL